MKIFQRGPADNDVTKLVQNEKKISPTRRQGDGDISPAADSAKVKISKEARQLQRIAELARKGDELRVEKLITLKEQIADGTYRPDMDEVAKDIVRSSVTGLLQKK